MNRVLSLVVVLAAPIIAWAETAEPDSPFLTALITWAPVLALIGLWWFFVRRMSFLGKGGYKQYMQSSQERLTQIEAHLASIADSLRKIAARE